MYFSEAFHVVTTAADDWFDPILDSDTRLFVDPFLIFQDHEQQWQQAHSTLIAHFNTCFQLIASSNRNRRALSYQKAIALLHFPEPREFCLGYTAVGTRGAGGGIEYAHLIAEPMEEAIIRGLKDLRHFEELGILNEGIGPDRISDLTCNTLRSFFIRYTQQVVTRHSIPTRNVEVGAASYDEGRQAWRRERVNLPWNPSGDRYVLLVPERFLRDLPVINAQDWWANYEAEQLRNDVNYEVMGRVSKGEIVAIARKHAALVDDWTLAQEGTEFSPYNFRSDPMGVWKWSAATREYVHSQPLVISPPADEAAFIAVIDLVVERYRHYIEESGGWKLLWNDGFIQEKPEEAAQLLFRGIAQAYCEANNIVLDREVNLGKGPVDFKFSNGYQRRALLEVKKLHNGHFWNGVTSQLPSYLSSEKTDLGWFVVIKYRSGGASDAWATRGPAIVREVATKHSVRLKTATVDGQPKKSASKQVDSSEQPPQDPYDRTSS